MDSEAMTSQTHEWVANLSCDFQCVLCHKNILISYPILLKLVLIGLSHFLLLLEISDIWNGLYLS